MTEFLGHFLGGPYNNEMMTVYADSRSDIIGRPARWQDFRRVLTNRHQRPIGRVGVFRYKLNDVQHRDDVWQYTYIDYVEEYGYA